MNQADALKLVGCVNSNIVCGKPPETLIVVEIDDCEKNRIVMQENPNNWNKVRHDLTGQYYRLNKPIFESAHIPEDVDVVIRPMPEKQ